MKAIWNDILLAESDDTVVVEGNHYFPLTSLKQEHFRHTDHHTICPWKGTASYMDVIVGEAVNTHAAWYYPSPSDRAMSIKDRVAFWRGVNVLP